MTPFVPTFTAPTTLFPPSFLWLLRHAAFWLVALFWTTTISESRMDFTYFNALFLLNLLRLPLLMAFVYGVSHYLVPRFLLPHDWQNFVGYAAGALLFIAFLDRLLMGSALSDWATAGSDLTYVFFNWVPILRNTTFLLVLAASASLLKWRRELFAPKLSVLPIAPKPFTVKCGTVDVVLDPASITHLSKDENYVVVHTENGRRLVRSSLTALLERLPAEDFLRVHRSHAIARKHLVEVASREVVLNTGAKLPLSRTYKTKVRAAI